MERPSPEEKLAVYAQLEELVEGIQHYDVLQFLLRKISVTLLIGTFAAIGFLLTIAPSELPFSSIDLSIFICLFAFLLNTVISAIDLIFVERLFLSVFINAIRIERKNPWVFPIHSHMLNSSRVHHGSLSKKIKFYIGYSEDLLLILLVCLSFLLGTDNWKWTAFIVAPIDVFFILIWGKLLRGAAAKSDRRIYKILESELGGPD